MGCNPWWPGNNLLNELAESSGVGIGLEQGALPLDPEVKAFSDILGLDPLYMANEGRFVAVVAPEDKESNYSVTSPNSCGKQGRPYRSGG